MADPYIGEIRMFAGNFAPNGWLMCSGQLVSISDYDTLFNLIGTTYGGDGMNTFALPDLQGRNPLHAGAGPLGSFFPGQTGGQESVTLTTAQLPQHTHVASAGSQIGTTTSPTGAVWAPSDYTQYAEGPGNTTMAPTALGPAGGSQPHENRSPALAINFIISCFGIYPSPS